MRGKDWGKCESIIHMLESLYELASTIDDDDVMAEVHQAIRKATDDIVKVTVDNSW